MKINIQITSEPLKIDDCRAFVSGDGNGAECFFIGTVRNKTKDKEVDHLYFEAYEPMAEKEMKTIAEEAFKKFEISSIVIHHRIGNLSIGEIPVIIGVGSAHRAASFAACQFAIDTLKQTVPIWKKEYFNDGNVWVSAHP